MPDVNATYEAPSARVVQSSVAAVTLAADLNTDLHVVQATGVIDSVSYVAAATLTGAATNFRTVSLVNKGAAGSGSTVIATLAFSSGAVVATADVPKTITLSATPANLNVAAGDVLQWQSLHTASGLADPGGLVVISIGRT